MRGEVSTLRERGKKRSFAEGTLLIYRPGGLIFEKKKGFKSTAQQNVLSKERAEAARYVNYFGRAAGSGLKEKGEPVKRV